MYNKSVAIDQFRYSSILSIFFVQIDELNNKNLGKSGVWAPITVLTTKLNCTYFMYPGFV